jgi:hypothetical protein
VPTVPHGCVIRVFCDVRCLDVADPWSSPVFRKILATVGAVALGASLALVAAAAPGLADESTDSAVASTGAPVDPTAEATEPAAEPNEPAVEPTDAIEPDDTSDSGEAGDSEETADEPLGAARLSAASFTTASTSSTVELCAAPNADTIVRTTTGMFFEDRAGGSHSLTANGLSIAWSHANLSLSKSAGYLPVDVPFAEVGVPGMGYTSTSGASAGLNLTLFKNGSWFGNLVDEPLFDAFWINKSVPGMSAGPNPSYQLAYGTLDEFLAAFEAAGWDVDVTAIGYSGGSGSVGAGVVTSLTIGCDTFVFEAATNQACTVFTPVAVDSLSDLDLSSTRSDGNNLIVDGALRVWTGTATGSPDPRKAAGYLDVPDFPLTQTGTVALGWTGTSPAPGGQMVVDLDGNGSADGILVFEPAFYGQNLWLASIAPGFATTGAPAVGGGGGSINGTIDQYLAVWPDAKGLAIGYSLGSGVTGDGMLTLIQAGCFQIVFDLPAVVPPATGGGTGTTGTTPAAGGGTAQLTTLPFTEDETDDDETDETDEPADDAPADDDPDGSPDPDATAGAGDQQGGTDLLLLWLALAAAVVLVFAGLFFLLFRRRRRDADA